MRGIGLWSNTALLVALAACASLPSNVERTRTNALADTAATRLGRALPIDWLL